MSKYPVLNLIKLSNSKKFNRESNDLLKNLLKDNNLKKIKSIKKTIEKKNNQVPYITYNTFDTEYKIYNINDINNFLNQFIEEEQ